HLAGLKARGLERVELLYGPVHGVLQDSLAGGRSRNREGPWSLPLQPVRLVHAEEEQLVLNDGAADRAAELIEVDGRPGDPVLVIEPVIRRKIAVPVKPVSRPVKLVRP